MIKKQICLQNGKVQIDFRMDLDEAFPADRHILNALVHQSSYEPEIAWLLMRALRPGDFVIDVGANVGFFTLMMAKLVGKEGHVLTVEPGADNFAKLVVNLQMNLTGPITLDNRVLSDREEIVKFYSSADDSGGHAMWPPSRWPENVKTQARGDVSFARQATSLSKIVYDGHVVPSSLNPNRPIRVIKIDVEGAEWKVLNGANDLFRRVGEAAFVIAEHNWFGMEQMGTSSKELRELAQAYGYKTWLLQRDDSAPKLVPDKSVLKPPSIINILFATEDSVAEAWPEVVF